MEAKFLLDRDVYIEYAQLYVLSDENADDLESRVAFKGQVNGLCGAAVTGKLFLVTGIDLGPMRLTAQLFQAEPAIDETWEDIVEASFAATSSNVVVREWGGVRYPLELVEGEYRIRYCARGMDEAEELGTTARPADSYLLQFWPGAVGSDLIVRQTSDAARRRHERLSTRR